LAGGVAVAGGAAAVAGGATASAVMVGVIGGVATVGCGAGERSTAGADAGADAGSGASAAAATSTRAGDATASTVGGLLLDEPTYAAMVALVTPAATIPTIINQRRCRFGAGGLRGWSSAVGSLGSPQCKVGRPGRPSAAWNSRSSLESRWSGCAFSV
jgi:hypothetical protein